MQDVEDWHRHPYLKSLSFSATLRERDFAALLYSGEVHHAAAQLLACRLPAEAAAVYRRARLYRDAVAVARLVSLGLIYGNIWQDNMQYMAR